MMSNRAKELLKDMKTKHWYYVDSVYPGLYIADINMKMIRKSKEVMLENIRHKLRKVREDDNCRVYMVK